MRTIPNEAPHSSATLAGSSGFVKHGQLQPDSYLSGREQGLPGHDGNVEVGRLNGQQHTAPRSLRIGFSELG